MKTTSLGLKKPEGTDPVDIQDFNDNADTIDAELKKRPEKTGDASNMTVAFTEPASLAELTSNDSMKGLFGKLKLVTRNVISLARLMGTTDITGIGNGTVTGALSTLNGNLDHLNWHYYSSVTQLGLSLSCSTDNIIDMLDACRPAALMIAMYKSDYPNIRFAPTGLRHLYTVTVPSAGYVSIQDHDLDNNIIYTCRHTGLYSDWLSNGISNLTIKTYNNPGHIPGYENMAVSAYTMGSIYQAMPDNSILQCSVWRPSWTSFSFPAGVGNYGALTIRRSTINAGSLQYHDLDNNIVYTRSKYGGAWNPSADAVPWKQLTNNAWEQLIAVSTQLSEADITLKNGHRLAEFNWLYVECGYGYNSYCYTLRTDRIRSLPSYRFRFPTNIYGNDTISSTYNTLQYVSETVLRVKTAGTDAGIVVYGHN